MHKIILQTLKAKNISLFSLSRNPKRFYTHKKFWNPNLCLLTDETHCKKSGRTLESTVSSAIDGGCTMVQYREKKKDSVSKKSEALSLFKICKEKKVPFIVNDDVDLALEIQADGVHLGQEDMPASQAREKLGNRALLGITVHNVAEVKKAIQDGADYLGTGAIYDSITKPVKNPLGLETLRELVKNSPLPIVAVGGINEPNSKKILETGVAGLAVCSHILLAEDPLRETKGLVTQIYNVQGEKVKKEIALSLKELRNKHPLVFNITNNVVMNQSANAVLAIGGSPIMASDLKEMEDIMNVSDALLLNIGTIREEIFESMLIAGRCANKLNKPIILDPVGVGASKFRFEIVRKLLEQLKISIIKGNSSEIFALYNENKGKQQKGVDGNAEIENPEKVVRELAESEDAIIAMTGYHDYISDGRSIIVLRNNCDYLQKITGSGCIAGSLIASFAAVEKDHLIAACAGIASLTCSSEMIEKDKDVKGPASFQVSLLDQLSFLDNISLERRINLLKIR